MRDGEVDRLRAAFPEPPVTRFAPAPTGFLHVGHVVNAIYVWGLARLLGGRVLLRIEDHDGERSRADYDRALLDDLEWLGFIPDEPSLASLRAGRCQGRQSDRTAVYEEALASLRAHGLVYACECSRREIAATRAPRSDGDAGEELRYPGTCATKQLEERSGRGVRVRLPDDVVAFDDLARGGQSQQPSAQCGDLLVRDRQGWWTYQFVATVDDMLQGVTLVVRGDDLLASTGRQVLLARMLGRTEPPRFFHHGLIMKTATQKLSKSDGDTGVRDLRRAGWDAPRVIGHAAWLAGLADADRPMDAAAAISRFGRNR